MFIAANIVVPTRRQAFKEQLLLGLQTRRFFKGYKMCPGGKNDGQDPRVAACRELLEETNVIAYEKSLQHVGVIQSYVNSEPLFDVDVFRAPHHEGAHQSRPFFPSEWVDKDKLPWRDMLIPDPAWLMYAIDGMWFGLLIAEFDQTPNKVEYRVDPSFERRLPPL